ncbi:DUF397 domain-containing protein [Kitasatospora sp. NBC_01266]|uniref:DUF397 domain-containing protein n=1 Tax=Kitasatospora sp. NBC_01266 TaxID=2903572 RepID=UPI002E2F650E|nr:DUF397 domain-containing protein [Kitasatospora sp. NBC_01266]
MQWCKSSYSNSTGECVEVAEDIAGVAPIRDSKDPHGPALTFSADAFAAFIAGLKSGYLPHA